MQKDSDYQLQKKLAKFIFSSSPHGLNNSNNGKYLNFSSEKIYIFNIYQISEYQFLLVLIGFHNSEYPWLFTVLRLKPRWRLIFEKFSEDEICAINEAVVQTNTKRATNSGLSVFTQLGRKLFSC